MPRNYRQKSGFRAVFHTRGGDLELRYRDGIPRSEAFAATINKGLRQPAGGFSISLPYRKVYANGIKPNDWVSLYLDDGYSQPDPYPYMIGLVDRVHERETSGENGAVDAFVEITGRDYGKLLAGIQLVQDPHLANHEDIGVLAEFMGSYAVGGYTENRLPLATPGEIVLRWIDIFHRNRNQFLTPYAINESRTDEAFPLDTSRVDRGGFVLSDGREVPAFIGWVSESNLSGNLWSLLQTYAEDPFTELFVDTIGGKPSVVLRQRPYSVADFARLEGESLNADEVFTANIGRGESDVANWFRVFFDMGNGQDVLAAVGRVGYMDARSIFAHGLRRMEPTTKLIGQKIFAQNVNGAGALENTGFLQDLSGLLAEWYYSSDRFWSGTFQTRIKPHLRPGVRLDYSNDRRGIYRSYYVEEVNHEFIYPGMSTTTITVSRGVDRGERAGVAVYDLATLATLERSGGVTALLNPELPPMFDAIMRQDTNTRFA